LPLDLDERIDARFGNEHVLAVDLPHHEPVLVQGDQTPPLGLRLPPSIGVHHQVGSAQYNPPPPDGSPCDRSANRGHRVCSDDSRSSHAAHLPLCRTSMGTSTGLALSRPGSSWIRPQPELVNAAGMSEAAFRQAKVTTKEADKPPALASPPACGPPQVSALHASRDRAIPTLEGHMSPGTREPPAASGP
jgi:hypothetical protein